MLADDHWPRRQAESPEWPTWRHGAPLGCTDTQRDRNSESDGDCKAAGRVSWVTVYIPRCPCE